MSGCCGGTTRDKGEKISATHKWDYIILSDFKSTSCFAPLSYGILYITLLISVACYIVDIFTAVQLLFNDRWAGQIKPAIPLNISRWIFSGCIILSWLLLAYRWYRAIRAMRTGGVAQSYLDPLAVRIQSIRMGERGRGWRRFLVFAELTKSKKGAEYIALFAYFSFEAWIRIIFAEGPRNVINGITLYTIMKSQLIPVGAHASKTGENPAAQFFINVKILADGSKTRAAVLFGMLFTLVIWVFAALSLAFSCLAYIMFLWHHIPSQDGGIRKYCKRKIDGRLQKIVDAKITKALATEDMKRSKLNLKAGKDPDPTDIKRQPTIPVLGGDSLSDMPLATRSSFGSLSSGHPDLERQATLPNVMGDVNRPTFPTRMPTNSSVASADSYSSNAPLMASAGPMGSGAPRSYSPAPSSRLGPSSSISSRPHTPGSRPPFQGPGGPMGPPSRQNTGTGMSHRPDGRFTPGPPQRQDTGNSYFPPAGRSTPNGRNSPALGGRPPPVQEFEMRSQTPQGGPGRSQGPGAFMTYNPAMNGSHQAAAPSFAQSSQRNFSTPPPRSFTSSPSRNFSTPSRGPPNGHLNQPPQRSGTAPPPSNAYDGSIYDSY